MNCITSNLKLLLSEGVRLVIKEQDKKMMVATEVEVGDEKYSKGVYIDSFEDLFEKFGNIVSSSLKATKRLKAKLLV